MFLTMKLGKRLNNEAYLKLEILNNKIIQGIDLSIKNMIEKSKKLDEKIAISKDGKVLIINAKDI
jgi:hypothetical protein